jgi:hypothetical protein
VVHECSDREIDTLLRRYRRPWRVLHHAVGVGRCEHPSGVASHMLAVTRVIPSSRTHTRRIGSTINQRRFLSTPKAAESSSGKAQMVIVDVDERIVDTAFLRT